MSNSIKLEVYTVRIKQKFQSEAMTYDEFNKNNSILDLVKGFIQKFDKEQMSDNVLQKTVEFRSADIVVKSSKRTIAGYVKRGEFGSSGELQTKSSTIPYGKDAVDKKPFYFLMWLPVKGQIGLVFLQRTGPRGIHDILFKQLKKYFEGLENMENIITPIFEPFISKGVARKYVEKGSINTITLRRYINSSDKGDNLSGFNEKVGSIDVVINAESGHFFTSANARALKYMTDPSVAFITNLGLQNLGFDATSKVLITSKFNGQTRKVDLNNAMLRPYYDIQDEVVIDDNGHPTFDSINKYTESLLTDIKKDLNIEE